MKYSELIHSLKKFSGDIKVIKNKFDKNSFFYFHLSNLENILITVEKRMKLGKVNFTLDPSLVISFDFYSGFCFSLNFMSNYNSSNVKNHLLAYGGRIDSYLTTKMN